MGRWGWVLVVGAVVAFAAPATTVAAPTGHDGARVNTFARGFDFDHKTGIGPVGLTFGEDRSLFVTDRHLYRFGPDGGSAEHARVTREPLAAVTGGLAWGLDGRLYAARHDFGPGDIVELDPGTGSVLRVVADHLQCPSALATDPASGDLFFSTVDCGHSIGRISDPGGAAPRVQTFATKLTADGLTFGRAGELYAAHAPDEQGRTVSVIDVRSGRRTGLATVDRADGIAIGRPAVGDSPPFLVVNRNDGTITKVDLQAPGAPHTDLVTGGSRGDLVAAGPDGCLYATQTDRVLRITNDNQTCDGGGAGPLEHGLLETRAVQLTRAVRRCAARARLKVGVHFGGRRLRSVRVFLGSRQVITLRHAALRRPVRLGALPARSFTVTLRATTRSGHRLVRRTRYSACGRHVLKAKARRR